LLSVHHRIYKTGTMNKMITFFKESYIELVDFVSWPKWQQLQQSTMIVIGASLMLTAVVALMDFVAGGSIMYIYKNFFK
jgi:preprotein translocase subunit SecE